MKRFISSVSATMLAATAMLGTTPAFAQPNEQFVPLLVYRTGPYAPNGTPWANGKQDYLKLINERDGGINGVKITYEECETGYATDRGIECYERLKGKGPTGATAFDPQSTGISFALTEKIPGDKIPLITPGYGRSESADGSVFKWAFPIMGSYWTAADILIQHIGKKEGGLEKLKGKKIAYVYHDSPYGKEPIAVLQERARRHGFELQLLPVTAPGVEQKATWLQVRQGKPDFVVLWGWGVMNSTALKEAQATGFPREKMFGVYWSGTEPDVKDVGAAAAGYSALNMQNELGLTAVAQDILKHVHGKGQGTGPKDEVGSILYNNGMIISMFTVEAVRTAQEKFGKGKPMTGEQVRWGLENLSLDEKRLTALGFNKLLHPIKTSCTDHMGVATARVQTWDGSKWKFVSEPIAADMSLLKPLITTGADKYAADRKITRRGDADCQN
ncbi:ABC transporter substrate-binding protein [Chitinimonas sp.]|uniref:ABC transporter substrate-binding protein n=1 Tax=Chitinimonas sp. TaxID=1934313 RepID=UPI0035B4D0CF